MRSRKKVVLVDESPEPEQLAREAARDRRLRKRLRRGVDLSEQPPARSRAASARAVGLAGAALIRLGRDRRVRGKVSEVLRALPPVQRRAEQQRKERARKRLLALAGVGGLAVAASLPPARRALMAPLSVLRGGSPRTITDTIEVEVPLSTAYNQWTQFEEFPRFMQGVEHVRQLDDTRLHWVVNVGGKQAEWDAKILEQHQDRQISWISEDGKKTRGTVTFEELAPSRTLIRLSMGYQAEGVREAVGSALGLDARRIRGDLARFKDLIEFRGAESGAWRGEVTGGERGLGAAS